MAEAPVSLPQARGFGQTSRRDGWWVQPLVVLLALGGFLVYAHYRVFEGTYYFSGQSAANKGTNYLTPFYSPLMFDAPGIHSGHAWLAAKPAWMPGWLSAAALILIFPAGFRFTCYYYRGAYYKAFWADPPSCAVGEPRKSYWGEQTLPLILQNVHRYFMYFALAFIAILAWDAVHGLWFQNEAGEWRFGIGVGTIVLALNAILLGGYTCGCHSLRHLVGGRHDCVAERPAGYKIYQCVSCLNRRHMLWAWMSLIWVAFTDIYVRMCATGAWTDVHVVF